MENNTKSTRKKSNKILAIDLGSYNSSIAVYEGNEVKIIPTPEGNNSMPSIVSFTKEGEIKVGEAAKRILSLNPTNSVFNIKRLMGYSYDEVKDLKRPYKIVNKENKPYVEVEFNGETRQYSPEEISAIILTRLKNIAEDYLDEEVEKAIITVPAYYDSTKRQSVMDAGSIAGLNVLRVVSEPTAASLNIKDKGEGKLYMVVDTGGCTSDVSIIDIDSDVYEVLATDGDSTLGGGLIDEAIVNYLADEFLKDSGVDVRKDPMSHQRIIEAAEKAKIELSASVSTDINLPYITVDMKTQTPLHLTKTLTRSKFDQISEFYVSRLKKLVDNSLNKSGKSISEISDILLVGGTTRVIAIQDMLEKVIGKKPNKSLNPDTAVATGAAINGGILEGTINDVLLLDVTPISFGIETSGQVFTKLVEANTTIPTAKTQVFSTFMDNQTSVEIHVLQGERVQANLNKSLGRFTLDGIKPAPRGVPQIEVSLNIDVNSILTVSAKDLETNKSHSIKIENSGNLSKEDIERMKADAEENAEADKKFKETADKINVLDNLTYTLKKDLEENKERLSAEIVESMDTLIVEIEKAKIERDTTIIEELINSYSDKTKTFYEEVGKIKAETNTETNTETTNTEENPDSEVVDAEVEEVK